MLFIVHLSFKLFTSYHSWHKGTWKLLWTYLIASWHRVWFALLLALLVYLLTIRVPTEESSSTKNRMPTMMEPIVRGVISSNPLGDIVCVDTSFNVEAGRGYEVVFEGWCEGGGWGLYLCPCLDQVNGWSLIPIRNFLFCCWNLCRVVKVGTAGSAVVVVFLNQEKARESGDDHSYINYIKF